MINRYMTDVAHLRSHHWKYWADVYNNCGFDCKYCVYRVGEKMGRITVAIPSREDFDREIRKDVLNGILYLGPKADIYQPRDTAGQLTRAVMQDLCSHRIPVFTVTRSKLALRDTDIMQDMASGGLIEVSITIASAKEIEALEPNTPTVKDRLDLIHALKRAGIPVSVHMSPIIPYLDSAEELQLLMRQCVDSGADCIYACVLGMSAAYADLVQKVVATHRPDIDVMSAFASADRRREIYSADSGYILGLMDALRDFAEAQAIPFACVHLPEYDTCERNGGIFRYKIPTVGDMCRHFVRRGMKTVSWPDLKSYLSGFSAVDGAVLESVETFWASGSLFKNTYFHPVVRENHVQGYERLTTLDIGITNMKVGVERKAVAAA